jgi:integrase
METGSRKNGPRNFWLSPSGQPRKGSALRDPGAAGRLCPAPAGARLARRRNYPAAGGPLGAGGSRREGKTHPHCRRPGLGQARHQRLVDRGRDPRGAALAEHRQGGKRGKSLSDRAVWSKVEQSAKQIGIERFGAHDLRRTCAKLCRKSGGDLEQVKFLLGHSSIQTTERYLGSEQEIAIAVDDSLGL